MKTTIVGVVACLISIFSTNASAQVLASEDEVKELFETLGRINRYSPVEHAGSHGSFGTSLGAGFSAAPLGQDTDIKRQTFDQEQVDANSMHYSPKIILVKGTPFPLDFGLIMTNISGARAQILSGHVQWSIIEGIGIPAIAVRGSYGQIINMEHVAFNSTTIDALLSYGLLRYFNVYGGVGLQRSQGRAELSSSSDGITLTSNEERISQGTYSSSVQRASLFGGVSISILPPFFSAGIELQRFSSAESALAAKLNLLL